MEICFCILPELGQNLGTAPSFSVYSRLELRCIACSILNLILTRDLQADKYRSLLLSKESALASVLTSVLRLERMKTGDKTLTFKLLKEVLCSVMILCQKNGKYVSPIVSHNGVRKM